METRDIEIEKKEVETKLMMALELIGEREEQIEILGADLDEFKSLYKQHIQMLSEELERAQGKQINNF